MGRRLPHDDSLLEQATRRKVFEAIHAQPGGNSATLGRRLAFSPSNVIWHGTKLEKAGLIHTHLIGRLRTYWPSEPKRRCPIEECPTNWARFLG
ncbi:MAG: helix-turn-helix domain-containing protein [Candidatus Thermoplasmatota archaeon]